jgi:hypothetical protein
VGSLATTTGIPAFWATARISEVLPVPGEPWSRHPHRHGTLWAMYQSSWVNQKWKLSETRFDSSDSA